MLGCDQQPLVASPWPDDACTIDAIFNTHGVFLLEREGAPPAYPLAHPGDVPVGQQALRYPKEDFLARWVYVFAQIVPKA
jgi:hypothetical protein